MEGIVPPKPHPLRDVTVILFLLPPLAPLGERKAKAWGGHRLCAGGMRNTRQPKVCNECSVCKVRNWCGRCMAGAWRVRGWCVAGAWRVCATGVCNGCVQRVCHVASLTSEEYEESESSPEETPSSSSCPPGSLFSSPVQRVRNGVQRVRNGLTL